MVASMVEPFMGPPLSEWSTMPSGSTPSSWHAPTNMAAASSLDSRSSTVQPTILRLHMSIIR